MFKFFLGPLPFKCDACSRSYKLKSSLINHVKYECGKTPQFHCKYCLYNTFRKGNLQRHELSKHQFVQQHYIAN